MKRSGHRPRIAITPGEPAGIGPDLVLALANHEFAADLVVFADPALLQARARELGLTLETRIMARPDAPIASTASTLWVSPARLRGPCRAGELDPTNAAYVIETLGHAADACRDGQCDALVTGPVHKGVINDAGMPFSGHTEFFAERVGGYPVMMLVADRLRVALATTHLPLADVPKAIDQALLERVLCILDRDLRERLHLESPRILVAGLNPHAGESGHLGREEIETISPVIERLRAAGLSVRGPLPADTLFTPRQLQDADAVLAMYHDQGLPVLKYAGFGHAVNVTLGLPIIRTSVDHGTALDLAGRGLAESGSLTSALHMAIDMARG